MADWVGAILATYVASDSTVANGYYLEFFENDGAYSTQKAAYKDAGKNTAWSNPLGPLTSAGLPDSADIYLDGIYDVKVYDGDPNNGGNLVRSIRNVGQNRSAVATDLENLVQNGSFEIDDDADNDPDNWTVTTNAVRSTTDPAHGAAHLRITDRNGNETATSAMFEVSELQDLEISFEVQVNNANATPKAHIEWYDKSQSQTTSPTSNTIWNPASGTLATSYARIVGLSIAPPSNARYAEIVFTGSDDGGVNRDVDIDNVVIRAKNRNDFAPRAPSGLELSRDSGDTDHDINVTAGAVQNEDFTEDMVLVSEITKQMDTGWAQGDDAGGWDSGALPADALAYVWLIKKSTTGEVDVLGSSSATSPTMPSGWDIKRLIGCWLLDASNNFVDGIHKGSYFYWFADLEDINDTTITESTYETGTLTAPPTSLAIVTARSHVGGTIDKDHYLDLRPKGSSWSGSDKGAWIGMEQNTDADTEAVTAMGEIYVDENSQMEYRMVGNGNTTTQDIIIYMRGCIMLTRDNP